MTRRRWIMLLPLVAAIALGALFLYGLREERNPQQLPSVMLGKMMPNFDLAAPDGGRFRTRDVAKDRVVIINFFASWCVPCRAEHPQLMQLSQRYKIPVYGIAWKDSPENVAAFLKQLGSPYARVGIDASGRTGIDWGIAGVPESFIITGKGIIRFRHWGDIRPEHVTERLLPVIRKLESQP